MLVHSENGKLHLLCYLLYRFTENAPLNEGAAALRGQRVQYRLEMAKFVPRLKRRLRGVVGLKHIQFSDKFQRDDFFPAGFIDQKIARDLEKIGLAAACCSDVAMRIGAGHAFGDQVVHVTGA